MKLSLPEIAIKRPVTVVMICVSLLGLGAIAWSRIPVEFIPRMDFPYIRCVIPYPGATPEQVVNEIAIPAEGEFRTISRLKRITTTSNSEGCSVGLQLDWSADMAMATAEVRDRMERLRLKLPDTVDRLYLRRFSSKSLPILALALSGEGDEEELAHKVRNKLQPRILRVDGVANVDVFTKPEKEVLIEFDQHALTSRGLALYDVVSQLQTSSLNLTVGELREGPTKFFVRAVDEFTEPAQLADLIIGANGLRLGDVAHVSMRSRQFDREISMDGRGGAFMIVLKEAEANAVATCRGVLAEIERARSDPEFEDLHAFVFFDQSEIIMAALNNLLTSGKYGGSLAVVVLLLFLRRLRPTVIVAAAIPTSVVVGLVFMFFSRMTLNVVTMCSLIIALGMLVDNAIVVIENIYRYSQMGLGPAESARRGASEVSMAITAATMTTLVVFVSLLYLEEGEMSNYMRQFAMPISVALLASLIIALTVIPLATSHMPELGKEARHRVRPRIIGAARRAFGDRVADHVALIERVRPLHWQMDYYGKALGWVMRNRLATLMLLGLLGAVTFLVPFRYVGQQGMPKIDSREVRIGITFEQNFDMAMAADTMEEIVSRINRQRDELGIKNVFVNYDPAGGQVSCYLYQPEDMPAGQKVPYATEEVLDILWQRLSQRTPGAKLDFSISESEGATRSISLRMRGDDSQTLDMYAELLMQQMARIANVSDVETDTERDAEEMQIVVDDALAKQFGLNPFLIARTVDFALRGSRLPYMKREGREVPVWAQFREEDRKNRENLANVKLMSPTGELIPLNRLVSLQRAKSPKSIQRVNAKNVITLSAKASGEDLARVKADLEAVVARFNLPKGYTIELGDMLLELDQDKANFITGILLAIILIYLVMGGLFESFILPLSILTSIPVSFVGVWWMMYFTQTPMDTISYIGMFLMVGVVVNNGIVIVDHMNQLRRGGLERTQAVVQAGQDRYRPVLMTALTTILGCVPLALGKGGAGDVAFYSLGRALIGGLTAGTFLTLFVVPLFYTLIDDLRVWMMAYFRDIIRLGRAAPGAVQDSSGVS